VSSLPGLVFLLAGQFEVYLAVRILRMVLHLLAFVFDKELIEIILNHKSQVDAVRLLLSRAFEVTILAALHALLQLVRRLPSIPTRSYLLNSIFADTAQV